MPRKGESSHDTHPFSEGLKLIKQCPVCSHEYTTGEVTVLDSRHEVQLAHIRCADCRGALVALMMVSPFGTSSVATLTDLSANEVADMRGKLVISQDDVLACHELLKNQASQFVHLLAKK